MRRRIALIAAAAVFGIGLGGLAPGAATAAESPGAGYVQGKKWDAFPIYNPNNVEPKRTTGGWSQVSSWQGFEQVREIVVAGKAGEVPDAARVYRATLGEPHLFTVANAVVAPVYLEGLRDTRANLTPSPLRMNTTLPSGDKVNYYCQATEWALPSAITAKVSVNATGMSGLGGSSTEALTNIGLANAPCAYVSRMEIILHAVLLTNDGVETATVFQWNASDSAAGMIYKGNREITDQVCATPEGRKLPECTFYKGTADGTDFSVVCAGAPEPEWLNFSWLGDYIGHYTRCMFVPVNGWDQDNQMMQAWVSGGIGQTVVPLTAAVNSFKLTESCGSLVNGNVQYLGNISIETCGWASWAGGIKIAIGVFAFLMFAFWGSGFIMETVSSISGKGKAPNPISGGGES